MIVPALDLPLDLFQCVEVVALLDCVHDILEVLVVHLGEEYLIDKGHQGVHDDDVVALL